MSSPIPQATAQNSESSAISNSLGERAMVDCLARPWVQTALTVTVMVGNVITHAFLVSIVTSLPLAAGGIIGATALLTSRLVHWVGDKMSLSDNSCIKIAKWAVGFFGGLAAGTALAKAAGFAITFKTAILLHIAANGAMIIGGVVIGGVVFALGIAGAVLHTMRNRLTEARQP